jgi:hypothetical protein
VGPNFDAMDTYVRLVAQRYRDDQRRFGPRFTTTFPYDGTLDDMCYVMQALQSALAPVQVSMINTYVYNGWILGIMHLSPAVPYHIH